MKIAIAKEHKDFFYKQGLIEFEDFLTQNQVAQFNKYINQALALRLNTNSQDLSNLTSEQVFLASRDLWRESAELKQLICQPRLAQIASDLIDKKPLRLAYDQLFPDCRKHMSFSNQGEQVYSHFLQQSASLEHVSSIRGILCGLILSLSDPITNGESNAIEGEGVDIFPAKSGHAIYFLPGTNLNLRKLVLHPSQRYYLIVYTQDSSFYLPQPNDPLTHSLKQYGYVINDKLKEKLHPMIYR